MDKRFLKDALGWGFLLWLVGYAVGFVLFFAVPPWAIGWVVMPFGIAITLWVLLRRIKTETFGYYVFIGIVWTLVAIVCDYFFLVRLFQPSDGYYKPDVYLYYVLTLALPIVVGWWKQSKQN